MNHENKTFARAATAICILLISAVLTGCASGPLTTDKQSGIYDEVVVHGPVVDPQHKKMRKVAGI